MSSAFIGGRPSKYKGQTIRWLFQEHGSKEKFVSFPSCKSDHCSRFSIFLCFIMVIQNQSSYPWIYSGMSSVLATCPLQEPIFFFSQRSDVLLNICSMKMFMESMVFYNKELLNAPKNMSPIICTLSNACALVNMVLQMTHKACWDMQNHFKEFNP